MSRLTLLLLLSVFFAQSIYAVDIAPARTKVTNKCTSYRMCDAEAGTGVCQDPSNTDDIVLKIGTTADYTLYSEDSTATDYTCNIFTSNNGTPGAGKNDQVNTASITDEVPVYTMFVLLRYWWINCSAIADNTVTIDAVACTR